MLEEAESVGAGPISGTARKIATTGRILSKIPVLSAFTSPASWAADVVAEAATVWGWSKPQNHTQTQPMVPRVLANHANCDTLDNTMNLALTSVNEVSPLACGLTQEDEMSFNYIKSKYAYTNYFYWSTSQTTNTSLYSVGVQPSSFTSALADGPVSFLATTPVAFVGRFFNYWRGGFVFRLKLVKTAFHSGRLLVTFNPNPKTLSAFTPTNTNVTSMWCHRVVVDIRDKTEVEFSVPYMNLLPWMPYNDAHGMGTVRISVLDPLIAASTVASNIHCLIEVKAADDFEVAVPTRATGLYKDVPFIPYQLQMGNGPDSGVKAVTELGHTTSDKLANTEFCIGEKIQSFRQLVKRYSLTWRGVQYKAIKIRPFRVTAGVNRNVTTFYPAENTDMLDLVSSCYLYSRGSMRIRVLEEEPKRSFCMTNLTMDNTSSGNLIDKITIGDEESLTQSSAEGCVLFHDTKRGAEVTVPMYHISYARALPAEVTNSAASADGYNFLMQQSPLSSQQILKFVGSTDENYTAVYRAAGEDFSLHGFICTPLVTNYT